MTFGRVLTLTSGHRAKIYTVTVVDASLHTTRDAVDYVYTR